MNFQKRKQAILRKLEGAGEADIKGLASEMKVAEITVRRDLNLLAADGLLYRTHGGAMKVDPFEPPYPFANKAAVNMEAKEAIARRAAAEVKDGDIVYMDCGSTVFRLCPFIKNKKIRVITNSLPVVYALQGSRVEVNVIGGEFDAERQAVHGKMAEYHIKKYRATMAFLGVDGISGAGLFANSEKEATLTLAMAGQSGTTYLLCDAGKIGKETYLHFADLSLIDTMITDAPAAACRAIRKAGVRVVHVSV
jgi:DeoR family fructose operon transcriptional repressor